MKWMFIPAIVLIHAGAVAQQLLSIDDALRIGKENSKTLQASEAKADAAAARAGEVRTSLLPSLKAEGGYKRLSDVGPFAVKLPIFPAPVEISPSVVNNYSVKLTLQQPIFTGLKLENASRSADLLADASSSDHRSDAADLVLNIRTAYWGLYQAVQIKTSVDENVQRLDLDRRDTQNLLKAGMATRNDLLRIEVQLSNAKLAQIDAANDLQVAAMTLNNVIGQPLETDVRLSSAPWPLSGDSLSVPDTLAPFRLLLRDALVSRPDVQAMDLRVQSASAGLSSARGGWWPQIFFTGSYYYSRPNIRFQPTIDAFKPSWELGVAAQWDLWNWGTTSYQTDQAAANLQQNQLLLDQMKDNVSLEVRRNMLAVRRAAEKIDVARTGVGQAEENLRTIKDKFKAGLATSADLMDAEVSMLQARTSFTAACVEHEISRARLDRALGKEE